MSFSEDVANSYDKTELRGDESATIEFLEELAQGGRALELGIGTGRIAIPLATRGIPVDGIDVSPAMVEKLRGKPGGEGIEVTQGHFADVAVPETYKLIYLVFNTLFNLLTQEEQVRCFENVAGHLAEDGSFVVEGFVPGYLHRLVDEQHVQAESIRVDEVRLDVLRHDAALQRIEESHVSLSGSRVRLTPVVQRYAWPSELDLMARIAGLRLKGRWSGWRKEPFTPTSRNCVSVYGV